MTRPSNARGMGGYPNKFGGQHIRSNPVEPYSDEFSDDIGDKRKTEFDAAAQRFTGAVNQLRKDLSLARTFDRIDELIMDFVGGDEQHYSEIVGDEGTLRSLARKGEMQKALGVISSNIELWSRKRLGVAAGTDMDAEMLSKFGTGTVEHEPQVNGIAKWS